MKSLIRSTWLALFLAGLCSQLSAATAPGAPTSVTAVAGNAQAVVSFTAPVSNGGNAITGYTATASPDGLTATGASSPLTVTGLANGTSYTFTVTATNSVGTGAASSASAAAMPGEWAKSYGLSGGSAEVFATTVDAAGNVYIAGNFTCATLAVGDVTLTRIGSSTDAFVAKLAATGTVVWAQNFGGSGAIASCKGVGVDSAGNVYVGGNFAYGSLTTPALGKIGGGDAFVVKLNAAGTVQWSHNYGGSGTNTYGKALAVDSTGNVYLGGDFNSGSLTTLGLNRIGSGFDAFALKLNTAGAITWAKNFGGSASFAYGEAIAVDSAGNVYLGGYFSGTSLTTPALPVKGYEDGFVVKLDASGASIWARNYGGTGAYAYVFALAVDSASNVYLGGYFIGTLTTPALAATGTYDAYALKVSSSGATTWSKKFGGSGAGTMAKAFAVDSADNVYVGGSFGSVHLTTPALDRIGLRDGFALKLNSDGTETWAINYGGSAAVATVNAVAVDSVGNVYAGGSFGNANLTTPELTKRGSTDALLIKQPYPFAVAPGAPTGVSAVAGDAQAAVSFTAPASTGGAVISGYTVTSNPGGFTATGAGSPLTVTGLTNGTSYTFTVTATNSAGTGAASAASGAITLLPTPTITTAPTASAITYGQTLAAATLTGGAGSVAGSFTFTAPSTAPGAGTAAQGVTFTPTDAAHYATATTTVSVTVNQATPTITWATPSAVAYGTTLSGAQLNATASVAGAFVYSPAAGTTPAVGTQTLGVTFTPTDTANYVNATGSVSLVVGKTTPTITTAPTASAITYGQMLSASALTGGAGSVAGSFAFTTASTAPGAGTAAQGVTFTPTDAAAYTTATTTVNVTVNQATPTLTWATPAAITRGATLSATQLNATASVAGTFVYNPAAGTTPAAGTQTLGVTFTPTDTTNYATATGSVALVVLNLATSTITTAPTASAITYGQTLAASTLTGGVASVGGTFAFTAPSTAPGAGTAAQGVTFTPTDTANYTAATTTTSVTVNKAPTTLTWATPATLLQGTALSGTQLNATASVAGAFVYSPAAGTTPPAGTQTLGVTFTPTDAANYAPATGSVLLVVGAVPSAPVITSVVIGYHTAIVSFSEPTQNGGFAVTLYTVTATPSSLVPTSGTIRALATRGQGRVAATAGTVVVTGTSSPITVTGLRDDMDYTFTVTATNGMGQGLPSAPSAPLRVIPPTRISNLSVRVNVGTGDNTLLIGCVIGGAGTGGLKPLLLRAVGPTLASYGVMGALLDPKLELLVPGAGAPLAANDDWAGDAQIITVGNMVGAFPLSSTASKDAALYQTIANGAYTAQVTGVGGTTGITLAEIYDASSTAYTTSTPRLVNFSARAHVGTGDGVLLVGFVVEGTANRTLLIRAVGPTLANYGLSGALADPRLELIQMVNNAAVAVATNDNWAGDAQITSVGSTVGAFSLGSASSKDAAIVVSLPPGVYTATVVGVGHTTGVALIEVYEVP